MIKNIISVSIAEADLLNLADEIDQVLLAGVDVIHLDVTDDQNFAVEFRPPFGKLLREYVLRASISAPLEADW